MLNSLPRRVRIYAALCHLSGFIWLVATVLLIVLVSSIGVFSLISVLIPGLTWLSTRKVHDFVDRSGREAVNAQLSVLLYTGCAVFITALACGMKMNMYTASPLGAGAAMLLIFIVPFGAMVYQIVSIVAAVQALRGNVLRYPLIIRFIPDPSLPL
jgi:uncharacterized Tic20 family protein